MSYLPLSLSEHNWYILFMKYKLYNSLFRISNKHDDFFFFYLYASRYVFVTAFVSDNRTLRIFLSLDRADNSIKSSVQISLYSPPFSTICGGFSSTLKNFFRLLPIESVDRSPESLPPTLLTLLYSTDLSQR